MNGIGAKFILADRFTFDSVSNSLIDKNFDDEFIRLGSNESRILLLFSQRPNEIVTRDELYDFVWREQGFEVDDSSLTQAISTLRKQLKDSTKSPQFIKTVPKRGYQFIARVSLPDEVEAPLQNSDIDSQLTESTDVEKTNTETGTPAEISSLVSTEVKETVSHPETFPEIERRKPVKASVDFVSKVLFLIALLLPLCAVLYTNPTQSEFRQLANYDGVVVNSPMNHPDLSKWLPSIEQCINTYKAKYADDTSLEKVIATGGQNDVLILNYIHKPELSASNITLKIIANKEEIDQVCQRGPSS